MNHAVILAGGSGERFWPASTPERPKQLLPLLSERSMLRETVDRLDGVVPPERRFVLTSRGLLSAVARELPEIPRAHLVGEPEVKNTAPALGLAAGLLQARDPEAVLLALPADHAIGDVTAFRHAVSAAFQLAAEQPVLVLFGIVPNRPDTGYGYIERGAALSPGTIEAYRVSRFREKPDAETARRLWRDGRHYWNSGLFCGRAGAFLEEFARHLPLLRKAVDSALARWSDDPQRALEGFYASVESTSFDVGIMQQTNRAVVLPAADWGWDDVGSWEALSRWVEADADGNVTLGTGALEGCRDVIVYAAGGRVAVLGMRNCVVVRAGDETLVAARDRLDDLKAFVRRVTGERGDS